MNFSGNLKLRPWMLLYAALVASLGLAGQQGADLTLDAARVSPVSAGAEMPSIRLNTIVRRSDI